MKKSFSLFLIACIILISSCDKEEKEMKQKDDILLNLETLEADTEQGVLKASRISESFVSSLNENTAIGITYYEDISIEDRNPSEIVAFIYENDELAILIGELDTLGNAVLESDSQSDFDASLQLSIDENTSTGTVTISEEEPESFEANRASANSGIYWASDTVNNEEIRGYWLVLSDNQQWGCVCLPPFRSPCCTLHL